MKNQPSLKTIIFLHLLPGIVVTLVFSGIAAWSTKQNLPTPLALLFTWVLAGIPFELGVLVYEGYRLNHRLSLKGVISFQEPVKQRQFIWLVILLLLWALISITLLTPLAELIRSTIFSWYPNHLLLTNFIQNINHYPKSTWWLVVIMSGLLNVVVPVVEELYFRGFLLPRLSALNKWAPFINVVLFSLYHFWLPWEFLTRIVALFPMSHAVWRNKNVFLSIWVHSLLNSFGTIGLLVLVLNQG